MENSQETFMRYVPMAEEIHEKQREQWREWELAASLAELASNGSGVRPQAQRFRQMKTSHR